MSDVGSCRLEYIGIIRTPHEKDVPYQPVTDDSSVFTVEIAPRYAEGIRDLDRFAYMYVLFHIDRIEREVSLTVAPPWAGGHTVGLFASRSPVRPNPIGLSIVRIKQIVDNVIYTSGLDVFDGTPVLDIKPYMDELDVKTDANLGWVDDLDDSEHLTLHIKGIPHDY